VITFLSSPKAWVGAATVQQENAVRNWLSLHPENEVILYGNAPGTLDACQRLGVRHAPNVAATPKGIPYFGAIADHAAHHARHDFQVYVNCDILLRRDLLTAAASVPWRRFLMIGQRIDLPEGEPQRPDLVQDDAWATSLASGGRLTLHPPAGSDYFGFRRGMWQEIPAITIGRGAYDNALIAWCLLRGIPVIDATLSVTAFHQSHGYGHVDGGRQEIFLGPEAEGNLAICRCLGMNPTVEDATWVCRAGRLVRCHGRGDRIRGALDRLLRLMPPGSCRRTAVRTWVKIRAMGLTASPILELSDLPVFSAKRGGV
jgi:hypothetical protein